MAMADAPHRRLQVALDLEAEDLHSLAGALMDIALDLELVGAERREVTSGGWAAGYHLTLDCDEDQDGDRYRVQLNDWIEARRG